MALNAENWHETPVPDDQDTERGSLKKINETLAPSGTFAIVNDTDLHVGDYRAIQALANAVIVSLAGSNVSLATPVSISFNVGAGRINHKFSKIKLSSGTVAVWEYS